MLRADATRALMYCDEAALPDWAKGFELVAIAAFVPGRLPLAGQ